MPQTHRPLVLVVLDGWGHREAAAHNAVLNAHTPVWDRLWNSYPHALIRASGAEVGLPARWADTQWSSWPRPEVR